MKNILLIAGSVTGGIIIAVLVLTLLLLGILTLIFMPSEQKVSLDTKDKSIDELKSLAAWVKYDCPEEVKNKSISQPQSGSGVLWSVSGTQAKIITNRHVLDCASNITDSCSESIAERAQIRLSNGKLYNASEIRFAPASLDLVLLTIELREGDVFNSSLTFRNSSLDVGDRVIAVSYPGFAEKVVEFVVAEGTVSKHHDLLTSDGLLFKGISSDAYASFGSSGGGLFDDKGNLVGIISFGSINSEEITAIDVMQVKESIDTGAFAPCLSAYGNA